jgi:sensor histidine kinase YesM
MQFKNKKQIYKHVLLSISFAIVTASIVGYLFQGAKIFSSFPFYIKYTGYGYSLFFTFWLGHLAIGHFTEKKLDWTKNLKRANVISLSSYIIFGIIIGTSITYIFSVNVFQVKGNDLFWDVLIKSLMIMVLDLFLISIYYSTNLTKYWKKAIESNEELKRENLIAKYEVLKNKVNPHFLFNSLNTLSSVIERKPELGSDFVKKLSDIYRYVLEQSDKELVSVDIEMKFVEDYIFLSKIRFGDALIFHSALAKNMNIQVVPLGLQTLVENAIKHNIISDDMPLQIEVGIEGGFIVLKNNIQKKIVIIPERKPHGLENLKNRYAYLTDSPIEITENDGVFLVKLPIIKTKSYELLDN